MKLSRAGIGALVVWFATIAYWISYYPSIKWGLRELSGYRSGEISPLEQRLVTRGQRVLLASGNVQRARAYFEAALRIDPYSDARLWIAECLAREGKPADAARELRVYLEKDPYFHAAYERLWELQDRHGVVPEWAKVFTDGLRRLSDELSKFRAVPDASVAAEFNEKAMRVYQEMEATIAFLRSKLRPTDSKVLKKQASLPLKKEST